MLYRKNNTAVTMMLLWRFILFIGENLSSKGVSPIESIKLL